ncbi:hypothetical protein HMPREF9374_3166 [Desmospora sp. 8437]|nr:hypothetical protein HMPREF9374_3166 [Desmospora sp. 8437]
MQEGIFVNIRISPLAAARLKVLLHWEEDGENLAVRLVPLTSGCGSPSFALELTEVRPDDHVIWVEGVPFTCPESDQAWLNGIEMDWNRETGRFSIHHPHPPFDGNCCLPGQNPG